MCRFFILVFYFEKKTRTVMYRFFYFGSYLFNKVFLGRCEESASSILCLKQDLPRLRLH